jgi:hypothetical protein
MSEQAIAEEVKNEETILEQSHSSDESSLDSSFFESGLEI